MEREYNLDLRKVVLGDTSRLRFIIRFSNCPRIHDESVSDHSFFVAIYSYFLGTALLADGAKLDLGKLLGKALLHDVDECFSGDFIRMFKHSSPELKEQIDKACMNMMAGYCSDVSSSTKVRLWTFGNWHESKIDLEGYIVSFADYLSVVSYVHQEIDLGNNRMRRQLPELWKFHSTFETEEKYLFLRPYVEQAKSILEELGGKDAS